MFNAFKNIVWNVPTAIRTTLNTTWESIQIKINYDINISKAVNLLS